MTRTARRGTLHSTTASIRTAALGLVAAVGLLTGVLLSGCAAADAPSTARSEPTAGGSAAAIATAAAPIGELEIHVIDVGQAAATLLRHDEATVLIDRGAPARTDVLDHLVDVGVDRLELLITTHPHADHLGQFDLIVDRLPVDEVWWSGARSTSQTFERALAALERSTAAYAEPRSGDAADIGPLLIEVVGPDAQADLDDPHDATLAVRATYGDVRLLVTGDAGVRTEQRLVARRPQLLAADVLIVGHHGSATSTSPELLAAVAPRIAVYSAGRDNRSCSFSFC